jgi:hypothetical protein
VAVTGGSLTRNSNKTGVRLWVLRFDCAQLRSTACVSTRDGRGSVTAMCTGAREDVTTLFARDLLSGPKLQLLAVLGQIVDPKQGGESNPAVPGTIPLLMFLTPIVEIRTVAM